MKTLCQRVRSSAGGLLGILLLSGQVAAAQLCADPDRQGMNALRAAAELTSDCSLASCDVDGDGVLTLGDGIDLLRSAAERRAALGCGAEDARAGTDGGPTAADDGGVIGASAASAVAVHFAFTAATSLEGLRIDVAYPTGKGGFRGSADAVACSTSSSAHFIKNDQDNGTLSLILGSDVALTPVLAKP